MAQDIELSQFHGMFFEECSEAIEQIESGLLELETGDTDLSVVNNIFRAAHSIKGSAGTFGFNIISEFTHDIESVFDEMRDSRREVSKDLVTMLFEGVDYLKELIRCCKEDQKVDDKAIAQFREKLLSFLAADSAPSEDAGKKGNDAADQAATCGWRISFHPHEDIFDNDGDPLRTLQALHDLGDVTIDAVFPKLPRFAKFDPKKCHVGWEIVLNAEVSQEQVEEIFAWDDCDLEITAKEAGKVSASDPSTHQGKNDSKRQKADDKGGANQELTTIRVDITKLDELLDLVGELVITQSMLLRECDTLIRERTEDFSQSLERLGRNIDDLRAQVMKIRMLPVDFAFQRLPRMVRDVAESLGKTVKLSLLGRSTALDKTVLEKISDPLVHLVRNALSHGIETPEQRRASGKDETGVLAIHAYHQGGNVVIKIADDGAGLDTDKILNIAKEKNLVEKTDALTTSEIKEMIFLPGFSTAKAVDDLSGRGVGMDVAKRNINDLGGVIEIESEQQKGTTFILRLPLTLAILEGQLVRVERQTYIFPLLSIVESVHIARQQTKMVAGKIEFFQYKNEYIPVIRLHRIFNFDSEATSCEDGFLVIFDTGNARAALYAEEVIGQQSILIKSLKKNFRQIQGLSGASILGDGSVALIIDPPGLLQCYSNYLAQEGVSRKELVEQIT